MDIKELLKLAENANLKIYQGDPDDSTRLLFWWMELCQSGDMALTFFPSCHTLAPFINIFQSGACRLAYSIDSDNKIQLALWGQPIGPGLAFVSIWIRKSFRGTKESTAIALRLYQIVFEMADLLFSVTKQEKVVRLSPKWGHKLIGKFPKIWEGEEGWLLSLSKSDFYSTVGLGE